MHRNCSFFFCSGSFFFNASSSSQGGFSAHFARCSYAPAADGPLCGSDQVRCGPLVVILMLFIVKNSFLGVIVS